MLSLFSSQFNHPFVGERNIIACWNIMYVSLIAVIFDWLTLHHPLSDLTSASFCPRVQRRHRIASQTKFLFLTWKRLFVQIRRSHNWLMLGTVSSPAEKRHAIITIRCNFQNIFCGRLIVSRAERWLCNIPVTFLSSRLDSRAFNLELVIRIWPPCRLEFTVGHFASQSHRRR